MRVSLNGYERDHGTKVLLETDLAEVDVVDYPYCYRDRAVVYRRKGDPLGESFVSVIARVNVKMQGSYKLEIRLTMSDILTLFWNGYKDRVFQTIFGISSNLPQPSAPNAGLS